jgi:hypothetical protein
MDREEGANLVGLVKVCCKSFCQCVDALVSLARPFAERRLTETRWKYPIPCRHGDQVPCLSCPRGRSQFQHRNDCHIYSEAYQFQMMAQKTSVMFCFFKHNETRSQPIRNLAKDHISYFKNGSKYTNKQRSFSSRPEDHSEVAISNEFTISWCLLGAKLIRRRPRNEG